MSNPSIDSTAAGTAESAPGRVFQTYEEELTHDLRLAMSEGGRFFQERSNVHFTLNRITTRLNELGIPYAVAGAMALVAHGYRRFTDDVDILVTPDGLLRLHEELDGRGFVPPFEKSKNLRDVETKVKIEFLLTGGFPGDGKPKPIAFPDPAKVAFEKDGIKYVNLPTLVNLKLASGMSHSGRARDLSDVGDLIKTLNLTESFAENLHPYVQTVFVRICRSQTETPTRYLSLWRNKWLTSESGSIEDMIAALRAATEHLEAMREDGVVLDADGGHSDDYAHLITTDPAIAKKYDMQEESEFLGDDKKENTDDPVT